MNDTALHQLISRSKLGAIGILTLGIVTAVAVASPLELAPVATEIVAPIDDDPAAQILTASSAMPRAINVPSSYPVSAARFRVIKSLAGTTPAGRDLIPRAEGFRIMASDVTTSFPGLDRPSAVDQGSVFFPPDTTVAQSNTRVLQATNAAVRLFTNAGGVLATEPLTSFFGAVPADGPLLSPKVYYDRQGSPLQRT
jgi:hypothetical protein